MEVCLIRFLYGRPLDTLLATWGVGMILQQVVSLSFGARPAADAPARRSCSGGCGDRRADHSASTACSSSASPLLCLLAVYLWFYKTSFGLKVRAVVQNRAMASALGISTRRVDSLTFAFATGLAGVAGCILAHLYTIKYNMGTDYIVEAFMVVILGGMGQTRPGTVGRRRQLIGTGNSVVGPRCLGNEPIAGQGGRAACWSSRFIMIRPSGLFAPKERAMSEPTRCAAAAPWRPAAARAAGARPLARRCGRLCCAWLLLSWRRCSLPAYCSWATTTTGCRCSPATWPWPCSP